MDIVLSQNSVDDYLQAFKQLLREDCRSFLIRGANVKALEFRKRVFEIFGDIDGLELALCDADEKWASIVPDTVTPAKACSMSFDAAIIFTGDISPVFEEFEKNRHSFRYVVYSAQGPRRIFLLSFEKCGTHMIARLPFLGKISLKMVQHEIEKKKSLARLLAEENAHCLLSHHLMFDISPREVVSALDGGGLKLLFNYRDPRAQALSFVNFYSDRKFKEIQENHEVQIHAELYRTYSPIPTVEERLKYFLAHHCMKYADHFMIHAPLLHHPSVCHVRYEDLAGPQGGGDRSIQVGSIRRIMRYLQTEGSAESIADELYSADSNTFFSGRIGRWREHFTPEIMDLFREKYRGVLEAYGYEW